MGQGSLPETISIATQSVFDRATHFLKKDIFHMSSISQSIVETLKVMIPGLNLVVTLLNRANLLLWSLDLFKHFKLYGFSH